MKLQQLLLLPVLCFGFFSMRGQEHTWVSYSDTFVENSTSHNNIPMLSKGLRKSSSAASVTVINENELDDNVLKSLWYALSVWKPMLSNVGNICIEVHVEEIDEDIRTDVLYCVNADGFSEPNALYTYLNGTLEMDATFPDGIITINSKSDWDYDLRENIDGSKKNLAYGIMRSFARILGFGSNVEVLGNGLYQFGDKRRHTVFNDLVSDSNGKKLSSLGLIRPNSELKTYIESGAKSFWVNTKTGNYKLQSPPFTKDNIPFVYLDDVNSLMGKVLQIGDYQLDVDEKTINILNELGWNMRPASQLRISSTDVPESGVTSAYTAHTFKIVSTNMDITSPRWELELPLKNGNKQVLNLTDKGLSCTVPSIQNESRYKVNMDGEIEAKLQFFGTINGNELGSEVYRLYLELKPIIEYAKVDNIVDNSPLDSYDVYYTVKYKGADKIKVSLEEEYNTQLRSRYYNEPYLLSGIVDHIMSPYYAWIDFIAENKYGKVVETIELGPYGEISSFGLPESIDINEQVTHANMCDTESAVDKIEVYDVNGSKICEIEHISELGALNGFFILKHMKNGSLSNTTKMVQ